MTHPRRASRPGTSVGDITSGMKTQEIDLRDERDADSDAQVNSELVPMQEEQPTEDFAVVMRGYDRRQVDDYAYRVDLALNEADSRHAEDGTRISTLETELSELRERLTLTEQRAEGRPEPITLIGERVATILRLAEEEATEARKRGAEQAAELLAEAKRQADREHAERLVVLEQREAEVNGAQAAADKLREDARVDADELRTRTDQECRQAVELAEARVIELTETGDEHAETIRLQAEEDVRVVHEQSRRDLDERRARAREELDDLAEQRDNLVQEMTEMDERLRALLGDRAR